MFLLYDKNMQKINFPSGVRPLDIFVSPIEKSRLSDTLEGADGKVFLGATDYNRPIEINLMLDGHDTMDYRLLRDEMYSLLSSDYFYIVEKYQKGKRYKVSSVQVGLPERINIYVAEMTASLETTELPYAESIGTTSIIDSNSVNSEDALWGFGMGLIADDDSLIYTHTGTSFRIYNAGDVPVHPFQQDLTITIDNVSGSTSFLQLRNTTNGTTFRINKGVTGSQTVVVGTGTITINSLQALRDTNKEFIILDPGWNQFQITGATNARTKFDFRFYYY